MLLAAFNQNLTGIPWTVGFMLASALALAVTIVVDRRAAARGGVVRLGQTGRAILAGIFVFAALALAAAATTHGATILFVVPVIGGLFTTLVFITAARGSGRR